MKKNKKYRKKVLYLILVPILILTLVLGFIIADHNIKKVEFGDTLPLFRFANYKTNHKHCVELNLFGSVYSLDVSSYYFFSVDLANSVIQTFENVKLLIMRQECNVCEKPCF